MKWIVGLLLLCNLAMFGYLTLFPNMLGSTAEETPAVAVPGTASLVLAEEFEGTLELRRPAVQAPSAPMVEAVEKGEENAQPENESGTLAQGAQPVAAAPPQRDPPGVAEQSLTTSCLRVGPFSQTGRVTEIAAEFEANDLNADLAEEKISEVRHWVHLSGAQSREEARDLVTQLESKGFIDHLIMNDPEHLHAISLGVFRDLPRGERLLGQLQDASFPAQLSPREVTRTLYWLETKNVAREEIEKAVSGMAAPQYKQLVIEECPGDE